ncbi:LysR substrate-binding domain-containing protein [Candidatus Halocynthiibacter alkanivorans]|uniref:LysR substrate-binding domain-containing protein n=1 Tax=Candidatus Halocynthiibacter alkanivorans TaxID=2267619 RepID=UPI000DF22B75|nr:LysR substrate-binding domain-containing protein [Candidatus Halocynthiibacter alkanivorans]
MQTGYETRSLINLCSNNYLGLSNDGRLIDAAHTALDAYELNDGLIDVAVMQIFKSNVQPTDIVLYEDQLHWIKSFDYEFDISKPIPFLSFDENCFFRHWALECGRSQEHIIDIVLECSSTAGIASAIVSGLGVSLLNGRHITPEMQVIDNIFTPPPDVAYVIRSNRKSRSKAVEILTQEIVREVGNIGALRVA